MMEHTCSYYCERPECIRAQRDELRDRLEKVDQGGAVAGVVLRGGFPTLLQEKYVLPTDIRLYTRPHDPALADALRQILGVTDPASSAYKIAAAALRKKSVKIKRNSRCHTCGVIGCVGSCAFTGV